MDKYIILFIFFYLTGCVSNPQKEVEKFSIENFNKLMNRIGFKEKKSGIYESSKFYTVKYASDEAIPLQEVEKYCKRLTNTYMSYSYSFSNKSNQDNIPRIVTDYVKSKTNSIDFSYTPCLKNNKTYFGVLTEFFTNKSNGYDVKYTFFMSDNIDKSLKNKEKQKKKNQIKALIMKRKIYALKHQYGTVYRKFFTQFQVGKMSIYNKEPIKKLYSKKSSIRERLCEDECMKLNNQNSGYYSLNSAQNNGWVMQSKTNHYQAQTIERVDGTFCSCYGVTYVLHRGKTYITSN